MTTLIIIGIIIAVIGTAGSITLGFYLIKKSHVTKEAACLVLHEEYHGTEEVIEFHTYHPVKNHSRKQNEKENVIHAMAYKTSGSFENIS